MADDYVTLIHLSDIHFTRETGGGLDLDKDVRNELLGDAENLVSGLPPPHILVVTGDIAYSALSEEYDLAQAWIEEACERTRTDLGAVLVTPGNHDIDRRQTGESEMIKLIHRDLRGGSPEDINPRLARKFRDSNAVTTMYSPLGAYNQFAARFNCDIGANRDYWETDVVLNDGSVLRMRGLNSVLVSDEFDNDRDSKLVLGSFQLTILKQAGIEYLTLCHHPPQWLIDADAAENLFKTRVRLQLFGHKHSQVLDQLNDTVRMTAGAVQPNREDRQWEPRYNIIRIRVDGSGEKRTLEVRVHARVWSNQARKFALAPELDGKEYREFRLALDPWSLEEGAATPTESSKDSETETSRVVPMLRARHLTYRYFGLPFQSRLAVAQSLGLIEDSDRSLPEGEMFRRFFARARERRLLERLWDEVAKSYPSESDENPFKGQ